MYLNDQLGDCTCAAAAHMSKLFSALMKAPAEPTDAEVRSLYFSVTGGADSGAVELDVLKAWRNVGLAGIKPFAFVAVNHNDANEIRVAASLFAGVYIGVAMPLTAQQETAAGEAWAQTSGQAGGWGGHAVNIVGYDSTGLTCITWGEPQKMTWGFWNAYCDEAYAILPNDWQLNTPDIGFDFKLLSADLEALAG